MLSSALRIVQIVRLMFWAYGYVTCMNLQRGHEHL